MSGDIRKALDIMRRAVDIAIENDCEKLSMKQVRVFNLISIT
jgi:Cdc6-like AAA superfamily ATPase